MAKDQNKKMIWWLLSGCFLIFAMVVVGGITRLTHSGLSITEWNLIMGVVPPLNEHDWNEAFSKYQMFPEYKYLNHDLTLESFKSIFMWEYIHRIIGRLLGIVFIVPFLYFYFKGKIGKKLMLRLLLIFGMGALQGFLGWYMVQSGLQDNPHVSHYRLALHLIMAFLTYSLLLYTALDLVDTEKIEYKEPEVIQKLKRLRQDVLLFFILLCLQVIYGGFVAGLKAGSIYNTFPSMGGEWLPQAVAALHPWWLNLFGNMAGVQFVHRSIAWILAVYGLFFIYAYLDKMIPLKVRRAILLLVLVLVLQFTLGVITLLYAVPLTMGVLHQLGAFMLLSSAILLLHRSKTAGNPAKEPQV